MYLNCAKSVLAAFSRNTSNSLSTANVYLSGSVRMCCHNDVINRKLTANAFLNAAHRCRCTQLTRNFYSRGLLRHSKMIRECCYKKFSFADYDIIGFDLDGTLLRYNLNEMIPLEYELLRRFMVEHKGYSPDLLKRVLNRDFLQKGLILDTDNGNILKLSNDSTILRAAHGTKMLTPAQIEETYGEERRWTVSTLFFQDPLSTWNGPLSEKMRTLLDYFDLTVSMVFAHVVDELDKLSENTSVIKCRYSRVWPDILDGLVMMYSRENFANGTSPYFRALCSEPERYLLKTNLQVILWLQELRACGKATYLLTGSNIDFANFTASYALGSNWQELFDCVVCFARKPGFFTERRPFLRIDQQTEICKSDIAITEILPLNSAYSQGNWQQLEKSLATKICKPLDEVSSLYVGDNLIQDVYTPVKHHDLDAVAVSEELCADDQKYEYRDLIDSACWGSYFCVDDTPTLMSSIIEKYSQLCVPLIDTIAEGGNPITHSFCCTNKKGYFPMSPAQLREKQ